MQKYILIGLIGIVLVGLGFTACTQGKIPDQRAAVAGTGERLPHQVPKALRVCKTDDDCIAVVASCCPCREGDYVGVHKAHAAEARTLHDPVDCGPCPPLEHITMKTICDADSLCQVIEVE